MTKKKAGPGRPKVQVDWSKLDFACKLGASLNITAGYCEVSEDSIEKVIRQKYAMTFREYREQKMANTKLKLIQTAMSMAFDKNNTMMIFCLKNLCGWADKVEHGFDENKKTVVLRYNLEGQKDPSDQESEG